MVLLFQVDPFPFQSEADRLWAEARMTCLLIRGSDGFVEVAESLGFLRGASSEERVQVIEDTKQRLRTFYEGLRDVLTPEVEADLRRVYPEHIGVGHAVIRRMPSEGGGLDFLCKCGDILTTALSGTSELP